MDSPGDVNVTGMQIGRYEVQQVLGKGGMATVYLALDPRFRRHVAIKILPRQFQHDPQFSARFEREAQTIASLEHVAIVPVYDYGEEDGQPYLVMRHLPGDSLSMRIKQGPMALDEVLPIIERIGSALDFAHARGVIHRDVKPGNIIFDTDGNAYLTDFGIVRLAESTTQLTNSGGLVGTPAYMAPEMADPDGLSPLVDIYALGVMLYEMLTGEQPFQATTPMGVLMAHVTRPIPRIGDKRPDLPAGMQIILEKALAKQPVDRYQSASAISHDLHALQQDPFFGLNDLLPVPTETFSDSEDATGTLVLAETPPPPSAEPVIDDKPRLVTPPPLRETDLVEPPVIPTKREKRAARAAQARMAVREQPPKKKGGCARFLLILFIIMIIALLLGLIGLGMLIGLSGQSLDEFFDASATPGANPTFDPDIITGALPAIEANGLWTPVIAEFDGVTMALVPPGCFLMGSNTDELELLDARCQQAMGTECLESFLDESPSHTQCFEQPFWIDVTEVTNDQFYIFDGTAATGSAWAADDEPRTNVTYNEAATFCRLRGGRLPSEPEWEFAARGPNRLVYPYGNEFDGSVTSYCDVSCLAEGADPGAMDGFSLMAPVGSFPGGASWVGALDMSGNAWEWVSTLYAEYPIITDSDVVYEAGDTNERVVRGGSYLDNLFHLRSALRHHLAPNTALDTLGFRCVRDFQLVDLELVFE